MAKKRLVVLAFSNLDSDPRVARHLDALLGEYRLVTCGLRAPRADVEKHLFLQVPNPAAQSRLRSGMRLLLRRFEAHYWSHPWITVTLAALSQESFDGILCNDILTLPVALKVARGKPVVFDAHEYSPAEFSERLAWRLSHGAFASYLCRTYIPRATASITVCDGIAAAFREAFRVRMHTIDNAAPFYDIRLHATASGAIRLIHHGGAVRARHLEAMLDTADQLDSRFTLDFMLVPSDAAYLNELKRRAASNPRVRFREPVPMDRIVETCSEYDIGIYLLRPVNPNHELALPNKLFEFIQARLAVAIGPSLEMSRFVSTHGCGVVSESFAPGALARTINGLSSTDIDRMKANSDRAAHDHNAGHNARRLREIVADALSKGR